MPHPGGIKRWCCLTSVAYIRSVGGVCSQPAAWHVLADRARLGRPGSRLPLCTSVAGLGVGILWRPPVYSLLTLLFLCFYILPKWQHRNIQVEWKHKTHYMHYTKTADAGLQMRWRWFGQSWAKVTAQSRSHGSVVKAMDGFAPSEPGFTSCWYP